MFELQHMCFEMYITLHKILSKFICIVCVYLDSCYCLFTDGPEHLDGF